MTCRATVPRAPPYTLEGAVAALQVRRLYPAPGKSIGPGIWLPPRASHLATTLPYVCTYVQAMHRHSAHGLPLDRSQILRDQEKIQARALVMQQAHESRDVPGTAPIRCTICGRTFARREHLRRHQKTHTKERPFQCSICDKSFSRQYVMLQIYALTPRLITDPSGMS